MAELKHNFSQAKMNKDLDERVVPTGQYRDALNIEVATSEGANVGAAQTLMGNTKHATMLNTTGNAYYGVPDTATVVGAIASPDKDKIYYFVSGGDSNISTEALAVKKDYILEYDVISQTMKYVFVDIYSVTTTLNTYDPSNPSVQPGNQSGVDLYLDQPAGTVASQTLNLTGVRVGMKVTLTSSSETLDQGLDANIYVNGITYSPLLSAGEVLGWGIKVSKSVTANSNDSVTFHGERVLNFNKNTIITGINILDDFIFWTDNNHEPKKISISRSIAGTGGIEFLTGAGIDSYDAISTLDVGDTFKGDTDYFHTRLVESVPTLTSEAPNYNVITFPDKKRAVYVDESHVTVIKKAPTQPLELKMSRSPENRQSWSGEFLNIPSDSLTTSTTNLNLGPSAVSVGDIVGSDLPNGVVFANQVDFRVGDIISLVEINDSVEEYTVRAEITASNVSSSNNLSLNDFQFKILSLADGIINETQKWTVKLFDKEPLFEFKFPRFSYRYKYIDGEYSPFAPFSQVAFLPSKYEYHPKKGYNLGMVNSLRSLQLMYYHYDEFSKPDDVVEIDLLYKEANNPTVYTVKTIKKSDKDPQWPDVAGEGYRRGSFRVTTDMIHAVVASNQLIRPYDNVPKKALSQEISANRLIYGNYVQNLTVLKDPVIQVSLDKSEGDGSGFALPSVKTQRTYQVGVVYSDKYGRETPVLTSKNATITVPKDAVKTRNRLSVKLDPTTEVPVWARYYSFYVKETSIEYYTMAMDRWYDAADGNIWISFPSSDRNKVDEETFLELKKGHGTDTVVTDPARYKILAIENEAPDSIKMVRTELGELLDTGSAVVGNATNGYPLQDQKFVTVQISAFENTFGDNLHISTPDRLFLRLFSQTNESEEYKVTRLIKGSTHYKLTIEGKFGPDASFVSSNDTYDGRIGQLKVVLYSSNFEAKPEFEGRFFAKIFKDELLVASLSQGNEEELVVSMTSGLGYINNNGYATNSYGNETYVPSLDRPFFGSGSGRNDPFSTDGGVLGVHPTEHNYEYLEDTYPNDYNFPNEDRYLWGESSEESFGLQRSSLENPSRALGNSQEGQEFWGNMNNNVQRFFIDSCTAFSWTGKNNDRTGNYYNTWQGGGGDFDAGDDGQIGGIFALMGSNEASDEQDPGAPPAGSYAHNPSSSPNAGIAGPGPVGGAQVGGMPSRGIWGGGKYMDISWSGMGVGWDGGSFGGPYAHELKNTSGDVRLTASDFIRNLVTPGTKFRFQRDPDAQVYTVSDFAGEPEGYNNLQYWETWADKFSGAWGIRNHSGGTATNSSKHQYEGWNLRQRWTVKVTPSIGSGPSGYNPVTGTNPYVIKDETNPDFRRAIRHDGSNQDVIEVVVPFVDVTSGKGVFTENPGIWETVPKESVDIDIYYQASGLIPLMLDGQTLEEYIPIGTTFQSTDGNEVSTTHTITGIYENSYGMGELDEPAMFSYTPSSISLVDNAFVDSIAANNNITLTKRGNYSFTAKVQSVLGGVFLRIFGGKISYGEVEGGRLQEQTHILSWNNCYTFFNGVESDRMRDDFNAPQLDNGVKASTVLAEQILEERRAHGLIWSGIYNSSSGVNNTNQFIAGEAITKDVNPVHGSIQKLLNRDTRLIMFCEDSVLRAVTNKDALYNADGKPQLVASNAVIGDVQSYEGNYGVSKNPESVAHTARHVYFADVNRGAVCSLSGEGIIAISDKGMSDYFSDTFDSHVYRALGTYDSRKDEYNLSIYKKQDPLFQINKDFETTLSYSRTSQGWSSFKSFLPDNGVSINNNYYTFKNGHLWKHHSNYTRNRFYDNNYDSSITLLFNNNPESVKSFGSINYEGSKAKISVFDYKSAQMFNNSYASTTNGASLGLSAAANVTDGEYFNLGGLATNYNAIPDGWYVDSIITNLQSCGNIEFKDKEGKFFGQISGEDTSISNLDEKEFSVQGLGHASMVHGGSAEDNPEEVTIKIDNNTSTTYTGNSGVGIVWDAQAD